MKISHWYIGIIMICLSTACPDEVKCFIFELRDNMQYVLGIILIILMIIGMCKIASNKKDNNKDDN